jgi:hypothetical protein
MNTEVRPGEEKDGRGQWPRWVGGGAVLGATAGLLFTGDTPGFYAGLVTGILLEGLVEFWRPHRRAWPVVVHLLVLVLGAALGAVVGSLIGWTVNRVNPFTSSAVVLRGAAVGALVALLDRLIAWVVFPAGAGLPADLDAEAEAQAAEDDPLFDQS